MNEKTKIFAVGTAFGAAVGFGMASFLLVAGAMYAVPQFLDAMNQRSASLTPSVMQMQDGSVGMPFDTSFPIERPVQAVSVQEKSEDVVHVRPVQGGGIGGAFSGEEIPLPKVPNPPAVPVVSQQAAAAVQPPQVIIVAPPAEEPAVQQNVQAMPMKPSADETLTAVMAKPVVLPKEDEIAFIGGEKIQMQDVP